MEAEQAKAKLLAVAEELGHEIRIFTNSANSAASKEYLLLQVTRKMREAEAAARRARITKAVIRVRFPDNYILEAKFQPSEKIESLMHLLMKVVARPDLPFYLCKHYLI
ncbi:plant UBX domain-containing protein 1-like [Phoenix dactylifera]|uniref:Plant UBX domain-containing protein 1-like n=1 Tax=Phoenix dactylifera TaxID=42345 RepID=A0A8B9B2C3_PHODC|nr:plant UBX domain-containing protein 1-like [Phoenix dactylifera]